MRSCCDQAAVPALHHQQPCTAAAAAAAAPRPIYPVGVAASQQLPNSFAAPDMPNTSSMAHLLGAGQFGTGFSAAAAAAVPGAAGPSVPHAAGPHRVDKYYEMDTKLHDLTARLGQLQLLMDHLKQLRKQEAALRAQLTGAAAAEAAMCSYAGWQ